MPTCFQSVLSLDISSIVPHDFDEEGAGCTPEQLSHLGRCFPKVRTLTCSGGRGFANTGALPFTGIWPDLQEVFFKKVSHSVGEGQAASLLRQAGMGPLVVTDLHKPALPGRVGLPLKEVHFVR